MHSSTPGRESARQRSSNTSDYGPPVGARQESVGAPATPTGASPHKRPRQRARPPAAPPPRPSRPVGRGRLHRHGRIQATPSRRHSGHQRPRPRDGSVTVGPSAVHTDMVEGEVRRGPNQSRSRGRGGPGDGEPARSRGHMAARRDLRDTETIDPSTTQPVRTGGSARPVRRAGERPPGRVARAADRSTRPAPQGRVHGGVACGCRA